MRRVIFGSAALVLTAAVTANGSPEFSQTADIGLTTADPGAVAGVEVLLAVSDPRRPGGKPKPLRRVVVALPRGTRIDTSAVARCPATDEALRARGAAACPAGSRLGSGEAHAVTGFGPNVDPVRHRVLAFNGTRELVLLVTPTGPVGWPFVLRARVSGDRVLSADVPPLPIPGTAALSRLAIGLDPVSSGGRPLLTSPPACGRGRRWTTLARLAYLDGTSTVVKSASSCRPRQSL